MAMVPYQQFQREAGACDKQPSALQIKAALVRLVAIAATYPHVKVQIASTDNAADTVFQGIASSERVRFISVFDTLCAKKHCVDLS
jgi:hypothetical protein